MGMLESLRSNALLRGLTDEQLATIAARSSTIELDAGELLFREGDPGDALFLVVRGHVHVFATATNDRGELILATYGPESFFGELALLGAERRTASARAGEPATVVRIDQHLFAELTEASPVVMANVGQSLVRHLVATTRAVVQRTQGEVVAVAVEDPGDVAPLTRLLEASLPGFHATPIALVSSVAGDPGALTVGDDEVRRTDAGDEYRGVTRWSFGDDSPNGDRSIPELLRRNIEAFRREWSRTVVIAALNDLRLSSLDGVFDRVFVVCRRIENLAGKPVKGAEIVPVIRDSSEIRSWNHAANTARLSRPAIVLQDRELRPRSGISEQPGDGVKRLARAIARQRVGIAFGAGGARGFAHIGVIRFLEERGVPVDAISGSSIGSLVAAAFAMGIDSQRGEAMLGEWLRGGQRQIIRPALSRHSILSGKGLDRTCRELFGDIRFSDLAIPLSVSVADLSTGRGLMVRDGPLWKAVRASCSIPAIFPPVVVGDRVLVDGGVCDPVPTTALTRLGADIRIAVNISYSPDDLNRWALEEGFEAPREAAMHDDLPNVLETYQASFGMALSDRAAHSSSLADVVVRPRFRVTAWHDFSSAPDQLRRGYDAACRVEDQLRLAMPWLGDPVDRPSNRTS